MNIRVMSLAEVVSVMQFAANKYRGSRNLQVFVENVYIDDGLPGDPYLNLVKKIGVEDMDGETSFPIVVAIVRVQEDTNLCFNGGDSNAGMLLLNKEGKPATAQEDVVAFRIANRFVNVIGRQYFWEKR